jgi:hypothetical protein
LYFVHLGKKQNTSSSVNEYRKKVKAETKVVDDISILSEVIRTATSLIDFDKALKQHEEIISSLLGKPRIKHQYFNDFEGEIKSLGAWGGDFVLATSNNEEKTSEGILKIKEYEQ